MVHVTADEAVKDFGMILDSVIIQGASISIATDSGAAVLISQEEWNNIQETLYLNSIPGMADSIKEGKAAPLSECLDTVGWNIN